MTPADNDLEATIRRIIREETGLTPVAPAEPLYPRMVQDAGPGGPRFFEQMEAGRKACDKRG